MGHVVRKQDPAERPPEEQPREDVEPTDAEIVRLVRRGDRDAYGLLVGRHGDLLYRHALRMSERPDEAADLVQVAFLKAYDNIRRCDPERFGGWLFRILSNLCLDHARDPRRHTVPLDDVTPTADPGPGPEDAVERSELRRRLNDALDLLTPEQREAFVLKHHEGYSYEEMSELLGVAADALKMRVHRAREALRTHLEGLG